MRYDCRQEGRDPRARYFPCPVRIVCAVTGERIPNVFFADTAPLGAAPSLGRFITDATGTPLVAPERKRRWIPDGRGGKKLEIYYDRLETWERRPWRAVSLKDGQVVAQSEGVA
ncbi:MAG: hypothetical protein E6Q76_19590 [Rhizobium sp.]|nr:MAG: hypothetical protein E6Q76_19590 [Rhizobium sp.]